jgi:hypothetical protein
VISWGAQGGTGGKMPPPSLYVKKGPARFCVYYNMHNLGVPDAQDAVGSLSGNMIST